MPTSVNLHIYISDNSLEENAKELQEALLSSLNDQRTADVRNNGNEGSTSIVQTNFEIQCIADLMESASGSESLLSHLKKTCNEISDKMDNYFDNLVRTAKDFFWKFMPRPDILPAIDMSDTPISDYDAVDSDNSRYHKNAAMPGDVDVVVIFGHCGPFPIDELLKALMKQHPTAFIAFLGCSGSD